MLWPVVQREILNVSDLNDKKGITKISGEVQGINLETWLLLKAEN